MDKKTITAMLLAFMVVKNPVSLDEVNRAFAQPQRIEASAVSEANIADNLSLTFEKQSFPTTEEKAQIIITEYQKEIEAENERLRIQEETRLAAENAAKVGLLTSNGLSATYVNIYTKAAETYNVPWQVLAAVHYTETGQRGDTVVSSYAGAQGPMQFMPSTFRAYGVDGDNNGTVQIGDVDDAIFSAANYLAANGANKGQVKNALYFYNHDYGYVNHVYSIAKKLGLS
jgi:membrane-bound lytic murein transglycosylase B